MASKGTADRRSGFGGGWFGDDDYVLESAADNKGGAPSSELRDAEDKIKRKMEDPELWKPRPPTEECPVCLVPLPLQESRSTYWACCVKKLCRACVAETGRALNITNRKREQKELPPMDPSCSFCRTPVSRQNSEWLKMVEDQVDKGDVEAMVTLAANYRDGDFGLTRDAAKVLELLHKAADLGFPEAIRKLGYYFFEGKPGIIEDADANKGRAYLEEAAKKGDAPARFYLGDIEDEHQQHDLAIKHFKLAATAGDEYAMKRLWKYFPSKLTKAELEETLRAHHAACDEMNSEERERLIAYDEAKAGNDSKLIRIYEHYYHGVITAKDLNKALKAYRSGHVDHAMSILDKGRRACGYAYM